MALKFELVCFQLKLLFIQYYNILEFCVSIIDFMLTNIDISLVIYFGFHSYFSKLQPGKVALFLLIIHVPIICCKILITMN